MSVWQKKKKQLRKLLSGVPNSPYTALKLSEAALQNIYDAIYNL
jgi:hypothetical protein